MRILVPVKRVVDGNVRVHIDAAGTRIETDRLKMAMNPFDEVAIEAALRLKEQTLAKEIVAVGIGPASTAETLRTALAMGADRALRIDAAETVEPWAVATILAAVCAIERPDLIIAGRQAIDDDAGEVGPRLAAHLGWPQAVGVSRLTLEDGKIEASCETETGLRTLYTALPAVIAVDLRLNEPRYVSLPGLMKAKKKPLEEKTPADYGIDPRSRITSLFLREAPPRPPGEMVETVPALIAALQAKRALS